MCHASCTQASQTRSKPIGTRVHCSLPLFPQPHLKTRVTTEANLHWHFGLHDSSWCPPRDANNCDAQKILVHGSGRMRWLAALNQTKCTWAPTEMLQPAEAVLVGKWAVLLGFAEILQVHPLTWTLAILTKANALCTVEGGRLLWRGRTRCINPSLCFEYLTTRMSWWKNQPIQCTCPFCSHKSHDTPHLHDQ